MADAGLVRIKPIEERGARGAATTHVVKLCEAHATSRQSIQVGRSDFTTIATNVRVTDVVSHDDDDVGAFSRTNG